jgi:hypothetical protein
MQLTWSERMQLEGSLRTLKNVVLRQLAQRFGQVPAKVRRRIEAMQTLEPLERIAGEILTVPSLAALRLD